MVAPRPHLLECEGVRIRRSAQKGRDLSAQGSRRRCCCALRRRGHRLPACGVAMCMCVRPTKEGRLCSCSSNIKHGAPLLVWFRNLVHVGDAACVGDSTASAVALLCRIPVSIGLVHRALDPGVTPSTRGFLGRLIRLTPAWRFSAPSTRKCRRVIQSPWSG